MDRSGCATEAVFDRDDCQSLSGAPTRRVADSPTADHLRKYGLIWRHRPNAAALGET